MLEDKTFLQAAKCSDELKWAVKEPGRQIYSAVLAALPEPDLVLSPAAPPVTYLHRSLADAEIFFLFNESDRELRLSARFRGHGAASFWDASTGRVAAARSWTRDAGFRLDLDLQPYESRFIVLGSLQEPLHGAEVPFENSAFTVRGHAIEITGEWSLSLDGRMVSSSLKPWSELGFMGYSGTGIYSKSVRVPPDAKRVWLDLGEVRYSASLRVNGHDCGTRAWRPFRWDITKAVVQGENHLEVEVFNTAANELAGNPARLREIESKGWLVNSYINTYMKFDVEMVPSGLLGPVRLS